MPNRYWVGGTGSWTAINTTNWSATSGGSGGASVPGVNDDVFINANSSPVPTYTITLGFDATIKSINFTGFSATATFTRSSSGVTITIAGGNVTLRDTAPQNTAAIIAFTGTPSTTGTITFNGGSIIPNTLNFQSGNYIIADTAITGTLTLASGATLTFNGAFNPSTSTLTNNGGTLTFNGPVAYLGYPSAINFNSGIVNINNNLTLSGYPLSVGTAVVTVNGPSGGGTSTMKIPDLTITGAGSLIFNARTFLTTGTITHSAGTLTFNNGKNNLSVPDVKCENYTTNPAGTPTRVLNIGASGDRVIWELTQTLSYTVWNSPNISNLTINGTNSIIKFTGFYTAGYYVGANFGDNVTLVAGVPTKTNSNINYGIIWFYRVTGNFNYIYGSNFFEDIWDGNPTPTSNYNLPAHNLCFQEGKIQVVKNFSVNGRNGARITLDSVVAGGGTLSTAAFYLYLNSSSTNLVGVSQLNIKHCQVFPSYPTTVPPAPAAAYWTALSSTLDLTADPSTGWYAPNTKYWVGGTGTWDTTSTANWADTPGGTSGADVPTADYNVVFNATSLSTAPGNTNTVTVVGSVVCKSLTFEGFTGTLSSNNLTTPVITIGSTGSGFLKLGDIINQYKGTFTLPESADITTNGRILQGNMIVGKAGGSVTGQIYNFVDFFKTVNTASLNITSGAVTFSGLDGTNKYNASIGQIILNTAAVSKSINCKNNAIELTGGGSASNTNVNVWQGDTNTTGYLTFATPLDLYVTNTTLPGGSYISGNSTIAFRDVYLRASGAIVGTNTAMTCRNLFIQSASPRITFNTTTVTGDVDFTGSTGTWDQTTLTNVLTIAGNLTLVQALTVTKSSNLTFNTPAGKTSLVTASSGTTWNKTFTNPIIINANASGTVTFNNITTLCTNTVTITSGTVTFRNLTATGLTVNGGTLDLASGYLISLTGTITNNVSTLTIPCNVTCSSLNGVAGNTLTISGTTTLTAAASINLTAAGASLILNGPLIPTGTIVVNSNGGSLTFGETLVSPSSITLTQGTLSIAKDIKCTTFSTNVTLPTTLVRNLIFTNTAPITIELTSSGVAWDFTSGSAGFSTAPVLNNNLTIKFTNTSTTATTTFAGGSLSYDVVWWNRQTVAPATTIGNNIVTGSNTYKLFKDGNEYNNSGSPITSFNIPTHSITFDNNSNQTFNNFKVNGTFGKLITLSSVTAGQPFAFTSTIISDSYINCYYLNIIGNTANIFSPSPPNYIWVAYSSTLGTLTSGWKLINTKYWVGKGTTPNWNDSGNWSVSSGSSGNAGFPGVTDVAIFDSKSSLGTQGPNVNINVAATCLNLKFAESDGTEASSVVVTGTSSLAIGQGLILSPNMTMWNPVTSTGYTGTITFAGDNDYSFISNGKQINSPIVFNSAASTGVWTFPDYFNSLSSVTLTRGTLNFTGVNSTVDPTTGVNYNATMSNFSSSTAATRRINIGSYNDAIVSFTASCSGTTLTTTGSPALVKGMTIRLSNGTSLGEIVSGSGNSWVVSIGGSYSSQTMKGGNYENGRIELTGGGAGVSNTFACWNQTIDTNLITNVDVMYVTGTSLGYKTINGSSIVPIKDVWFYGKGSVIGIVNNNSKIGNIYVRTVGDTATSTRFNISLGSTIGSLDFTGAKVNWSVDSSNTGCTLTGSLRLSTNVSTVGAYALIAGQDLTFTPTSNISISKGGYVGKYPQRVTVNDTSTPNKIITYAFSSTEFVLTNGTIDITNGKYIDATTATINGGTLLTSVNDPDPNLSSFLLSDIDNLNGTTGTLIIGPSANITNQGYTSFRYITVNGSLTLGTSSSYINATTLYSGRIPQTSPPISAILGTIDVIGTLNIHSYADILNCDIEVGTSTASGTLNCYNKLLTFGNITLTQGNINLKYQNPVAEPINFTCSRFISTSGLTRSITIGKGILELTSNTSTPSTTAAWEVSNLTGISKIDALESTILITGTNATTYQVAFNGGVNITGTPSSYTITNLNIKYGEVIFNRINSTGNVNLYGSNTFKKFEDSGVVNTGNVHNLLIQSGSINVFDNFVINGFDSTKRLTLNSTTAGTAHNLVLTTLGSVTQYEYLNIKDSNAYPVQNPSLWVARGSLDSGNNSGWFFTTNKRYWTGFLNTNWNNNNNWSDIPGGTSPASYPSDTNLLPVIFDDASSPNPCYINTDAAAALDFDCTNYTGTFTRASGAALDIYGNANIGPSFAVVDAYTNFNSLVNGGTNTITYTGTSLTPLICGLRFYGPGKWQLGSNIYTTSYISLYTGTLDTGGYDMTADNFSYNNVSSATLNLNNSTITLTGTGETWNLTEGDATNLTLNAGTSTIEMTGLGVDYVRFRGGGKTYYKVKFNRGANANNNYLGGTGGYNIYEFSDLGTSVHNIYFGGSNFVFGNIILNTTINPLATNRVTFQVEAPYTQYYFDSTISTKIDCRYVTVNQCTAVPCKFIGSVGYINGPDTTGWNSTGCGNGALLLIGVGQ